MTLFFTRDRRDLGDTSSQLVPPRNRSTGAVLVSQDTALKHSAVWAALRLRADLVSTMNLRTFRTVGDIQFDVPPTRFLEDPGGDGYGLCDWLYSSQVDLDRLGNTFGVIKAFDALGYPAVVELVDASTVTLRGKDRKIVAYRIGGVYYTPDQIWHERQFTIAGSPIGLSPIAYAVWTIGNYLSAQQFGLDWWRNGRVPSLHVKNTGRKLDPTEAQVAKDRYSATIAHREPLVTGSDWEINMLAVKDGESQFLETERFSVVEIARFLGVPADMIDAETTSRGNSRITYSNITQRNLQFLVMNLSSTLVRREKRLSSMALPRPRTVEFDPTNTLLRLDPQTRALVLGQMVEDRLLTPTEARDMDNRQPYTDEQYQEFDRLFGQPVMAPDTTPQPDNRARRWRRQHQEDEQ